MVNKRLVMKIGIVLAIVLVMPSLITEAMIARQTENGLGRVDPDRQSTPTPTAALPVQPDEIVSGIHGAVHTFAISPDGSLLATGGCTSWNIGDHLNLYCTHGDVKLWNLSTKTPIASSIPAYTGNITQVAFSPDSKTLVVLGCDTSCLNNILVTWDLAADRQIGQITQLVYNIYNIQGFAISPDGQWLAYIYCKNDLPQPCSPEIVQWDIRKNREIVEFPAPEAKFILWNFSISTDGKLGVISATQGNQNHLIVWDIASQRLVYSITSNTNDSSTEFQFSPDGTTVATLSNSGLSSWNATTGAHIDNFSVPNLGDDGQFAFSDNGVVTIYIGMNANIVEKWDLSKQAAISQVTIASMAQNTRLHNSATLSANGKWLAVSSCSDLTESVQAQKVCLTSEIWVWKLS